MKDKIKKGFESVFNKSAEAVCFAPGRVNLIGEHTDYNGGHVLPCAISMGIYCAAARRADKEFRFYSNDFAH
ncbi:MAG: galactokinase, partial [Clostridia bacterium]|nr:galactokinase [Clostridia bacterium]